MDFFKKKHLKGKKKEGKEKNKLQCYFLLKLTRIYVASKKVQFAQFAQIYKSLEVFGPCIKITIQII